MCRNFSHGPCFLFILLAVYMQWVHKSILILIFKPLSGMNVRFYDISFVLEAIGDQAFQRAETLQIVSLNYLNACFFVSISFDTLVD